MKFQISIKFWIYIFIKFDIAHHVIQDELGKKMSIRAAIRFLLLLLKGRLVKNN